MRFRFPHTLVYWAPRGADSFGRPAFLAPVQYDCRWEDGTTEDVQPAEGHDYSRATVYLAEPLLVGGVVMQGTLDDVGSGFPANPREQAGVFEVVDIQRSQNLKANKTLYIGRLK